MNVRRLTERDRSSLESLLVRDPITHCFVTSRVEAGGVDAWLAGGDFWGYLDDNDTVESALFIGANLVPIETTPATRAAFADRLRSTGRRCSSMVGPVEEVLDLWRLIDSSWGPARDVRTNQPLLVCDAPPTFAIDPDVRLVRPTELDVLLPACIAMFTEEVGVSPVTGGTHALYRARIAELVQAKHSMARFDDEGIVFKAEIGAVSDEACQVQGVWVRPNLRGRGLAAPGMAAVVAYALEHVAPRVSLYVNDYNTAARKVYSAVGFRQHSTFATVLI